MKTFSLTAPCKDCPFRTDIKFYLRADRVKEICEGITTGDLSFHCHKTTRHDEYGETVPHQKEMHCAGAMIMLEHMNRPNQMMRIAERLGLYNRRNLKMDSPVYKSAQKMIRAYKASFINGR